MPIFLRQSTASQEIPLGFFVDSTDGNTEETGLTIANTDIKIWKTGATTLANKNSGGATHISNGLYYAVLDATDTDTIGPMLVYCHPSGALATRTEVTVLDEAVYDVLFGTTALATVSNITGGTITTATNVTTVNGLAANVITATAINAGAITSAKFAAGAIDAAAIATGAIDADAVAADAATEIANAVWDTDCTARQTQGTFGQAIGDPGADTNTIFKAVVTDATGATVGVDVVDLKTQIGVAGAGLTAIDLPDQTMNITGNLSGSVGSVTGNVGGNVTGSVGSLAAQAKTDVNAEVVDALATDTYAEPIGVPAATDDLATKIGYVYMALRNRVDVTSTKKTFYDDGGAAEWEKDLSDDGTTYSESEGNAI